MMKPWRKQFGIWVPNRKLSDNRGFISPALIGAVAGSRRRVSGYAASATRFAGDGQCWLERDAAITGAADSTKYTASFWINFKGGNGVAQVILSSANTKCNISKTVTTNLIAFTNRVADGSTIKVNVSQDSAKVAAITSSTGWVHVAFSVDNTNGAGVARLYINRVECATVTTLAADGSNLDFTDTDWSFGASIGGTNYINAEVSEYWMLIGTAVNFATTSNLDKFVTSELKPVDLGTDGTTPGFGTPNLYFKNPYSTFTTNSGGGGDMVKKGTTALAAGTAP